MESASPWMLRIVLDRKKKESKELTNNDIAKHINTEWAGDLSQWNENQTMFDQSVALRMATVH
jgi:hypothetical protein